MVEIFVDTSALYALLDADDQHHHEAAATLEWLRSDADLVTTNYVQVECLALVRRRLGRDSANRLVDGLFPLARVIWVDEATHVAALHVHRQAASSASFVDQVSFAVMSAHGVREAFAFDKDFGLHGFAAPMPDDQRPRHKVNEAAAAYGDENAAGLVSVAEIAARSQRSVNTVQSWRRRNADFPRPVAQLSAGPIWDWPAVETWVKGRSRRSGAQVEGAPFSEIKDKVYPPVHLPVSSLDLLMEERGQR